VGPCDRGKGRVCAKNRKDISIVREERREVCEFIEKQLRKGYIRPSKSPQMAPAFFVGKKNGKKRMVQDYRYLNEWAIKNSYLLPLISDTVENIGTKSI